MNADRVEFQKLLNNIEEGDTLVVTKLDRFTRSAEDGFKLVRELLQKDFKVHILNMGLIEDTDMGRVILRMLSAISEFDRDMIVARLAEGKAIAKLNSDFKEGRPKTYSRKQLDHTTELLEKKSYTEVEQVTGISRSTLTREKRKRKAIES